MGRILSDYQLNRKRFECLEYNDVMVNERDLHTSDWEGMGSSPEYFFEKLRLKFESSPGTWDIEEVFRMVFVSLEERERNMVLEAYGSKLAEKEGLKELMGQFLGKEELKKIEDEATRRYLQEDLISGSTPG